MNIQKLLFWKHKKDGQVIKKDCYKKLPSTVQNHYHPTDEQPTHYIDDSGLITGIIVGEMLADNSTDQTTQDNSSAFDGFGGGDFGGGGSSESFDTPDTSSNDSGSSYDSGSSGSSDY